jgi:deferrochelatase/peroxidase EfeB
MRTMIRPVVMAVMAISSVLLVGCNASQDSAPKEAAPVGAPSLELKATTAQLMNWILDSRADVVWAAVGSVITEKGEEQLAPKTDEEWNAVRNAAAIVAETGNLLMLAPHARDQGDWTAMTRTMIEEANKCVQAAEAKDLETLFTAGGDMYLACTACHAKYVIGEPLKK